MALAGKELGSFLDEPHLAHFATIGPDGKPRVRPLWFCFAEGALWNGCTSTHSTFFMGATKRAMPSTFAGSSVARGAPVSRRARVREWRPSTDRLGPCDAPSRSPRQSGPSGSRSEPACTRAR